MRRRIALFMLMVTIMGAFAGCGTKAECDFCGEEKKCSTKTVFGEEINYCKDCENEINDMFK